MKVSGPQPRRAGKQLGSDDVRLVKNFFFQVWLLEKQNSREAIDPSLEFDIFERDIFSESAPPTLGPGPGPGPAPARRTLRAPVPAYSSPLAETLVVTSLGHGSPAWAFAPTPRPDKFPGVNAASAASSAENAGVPNGRFSHSPRPARNSKHPSHHQPTGAHAVPGPPIDPAFPGPLNHNDQAVFATVGTHTPRGQGLSAARLVTATAGDGHEVEAGLADRLEARPRRDDNDSDGSTASSRPLLTVALGIGRTDRQIGARRVAPRAHRRTAASAGVGAGHKHTAHLRHSNFARLGFSRQGSA
jgi:hypothetical protein